MDISSCILFCRCGGSITGETDLINFRESLKDSGIDVIELHDLCAFSLNEKTELEAIGKKYIKKYIIACYSRTVDHLFRQTNTEIGRYEVISLREYSAVDLIYRINSLKEQKNGNAHFEIKKSGLKVPSWFPIIDKSRCILCGQCADFCLFGVYKYDKKSLTVANPLSCKNGCPACGRSCPSSAIIFPKVPERSILAGADPGKTDSGYQSNTVDESVFDQLKERNRNRKNIVRNEIIIKAEEERKKALEEISANKSGTCSI